MPKSVDASFTLRSSLIYSRNYKIDSTSSNRAVSVKAIAMGFGYIRTD